MAYTGIDVPMAFHGVVVNFKNNQYEGEEYY